MAFCVATTSVSASAQDEDGEADSGESQSLSSALEEEQLNAELESPAADDNSPTLLSDDQANAEDADEKLRSDTDPYENDEDAYMFLGAHYEHRFVLGFMEGIFLDVYETATIPSFGLQFTYRIADFDMVAAINYANFSVSGFFRGKNQPDGETEYVDAALHAITASITFLWSSMFTDVIGLQYGLSIGAGAMFGELSRTEAYRDADSNTYEKCGSFGVPDSDYCEKNGEYGADEKTWFDGGSKPPMWFRFAPIVGLRIKPIHQVVISVYTGFDVFSGILVGSSVSYGF